MADFSVTHVETHDESKPAGTRARSLGDDDIREFKRTERERQAVDHQRASDETGLTDIGIHKKVTFKISAADPTTYDNVGYLYVKTTGGREELFYKDDAGNVIQLTVNGTINDSVLTKTGDWMLSSVTTARTGWTNVSATYSNKFMRINATPLTTGGADTHTHTLTTATSGSGANVGTGAATASGIDHTHTGSTASGDNVPAYVQVVVFQKD